MLQRGYAMSWIACFTTKQDRIYFCAQIRCTGALSYFLRIPGLAMAAKRGFITFLRQLALKPRLCQIHGFGFATHMPDPSDDLRPRNIRSAISLSTSISSLVSCYRLLYHLKTSSTARRKTSVVASSVWIWPVNFGARVSGFKTQPKRAASDMTSTMKRPTGKG